MTFYVSLQYWPIISSRMRPVVLRTLVTLFCVLMGHAKNLFPERFWNHKLSCLCVRHNITWTVQKVSLLQESIMITFP